MGRRIALRDSIYLAAREHLVHDVAPQLRTISPRAIERTRLDNGVLMSRRVYLTDLDAFDAILARHRGDLRGAVRDIITAARSNPEHPLVAR